jgi:hypothetical protein
MMDHSQGCPAGNALAGSFSVSNEVPQPHDLVAFGLMILKPASERESE